MYSYEQGLQLLQRFGMTQKRIDHSQAVAAFAWQLARQIHEAHPDLPVNPDKVRIGALLHDIGRCRNDEDHQRASEKMLRELGMEDIAAIVMHGPIYEIEKLRGNDDATLLPDTIENKIVAYADARVRKEPITLAQRFADLMKRKKDNPFLCEAIRLSRPRLERTEKELYDLTPQRG